MVVPAFYHELGEGLRHAAGDGRSIALQNPRHHMKGVILALIRVCPHELSPHEDTKAVHINWEANADLLAVARNLGAHENARCYFIIDHVAEGDDYLGYVGLGRRDDIRAADVPDGFPVSTPQGDISPPAPRRKATGRIQEVSAIAPSTRPQPLPASRYAAFSGREAMADVSVVA